MPLKLESLQTQISKKKYDWTAGETSVSNLSSGEVEGCLGLIVTEAELAATATAVKAAENLNKTFAAAYPEAFASPSAIDWRNNGGNYTTPIKNQNPCGSCVSFGTLATIESRMKIKCQTPNVNPDYAEAFLFYCGCGTCCGTGWNFAPALDFCKNTGVAKETAFPYTPVNQPCKAGVTPDFKITAWTTVLSVADRKNIISSKGPVVGGMEVYTDFFSYTGGVYKHTSGDLEGYHAISVVGYDDVNKCWICKNSWGTGWGESGWFKIGYGQCKIDTDFAFYDVSLNCYPPPPVNNQCEQYIPVLKNVLLFSQTNATLKRCLRYHVCHKPGIPPICLPSFMSVVNLVNRILQLCPQYRKPFCDALG